MKKRSIFKKIMVLVIILIVVFLAWKFLKNDSGTGSDKNQVVDTKILGNAKDLISFSINPGQTVTGTLAVSGSVEGGYFFEANILVNILDINKKLLRSGHGSANTDWMTTGPVGFGAILDFTKLPIGPAYIEIHNDNPAGPEEGFNKSILIPVIIK